MFIILSTTIINLLITETISLKYDCDKAYIFFHVRCRLVKILFLFLIVGTIMYRKEFIFFNYVSAKLAVCCSLQRIRSNTLFLKINNDF